MDFERSRFSLGEFLIPALAGNPRKLSETGESIDLSCIADVFSIDDLSEFSNEDIGGPIPTKGVAVSSTVSSVPSQTIAKHDSCSSFEDDFPLIDGIKSVCPIYDYEIGGLEWLSDFGEYSFVAMEGSNSGGSVGGSSSVGDSEKQTVTDSGEEGLVTESAVVNERSSLLEMVVPGRARSKRARVAAVPVWSYEETMEKRRTKGIQDSSAQPRRCTHCLTQRTPQWRAGPSGPKSLCNACGVRFKSGRLFPEYRPAKSPTFVSSMHSNSHKRVLQMRGQTDDITRQEQLPFGKQQPQDR